MIVSRSLLRPLAAVSSRSASGGGAVVLRSAASASFALSPLVRARALSTRDASPTKAGPSGNGGGNSGGNSDGNDKGKEDGGHVRGTNLEFFVTTFLGAFLGAFIYRSMIEAASKSTAADQDGKNPKPKPESESDLDGALRALHDAFGGDAARISTDKDDLHHRGYSAWTYHPAALPSVVVWPQSVEECVRIVRIAAEYGCAIVPFAGGTSLESHFAALPPEQAEREGIPVKPTISVDFELMSDVLEFHPEDGDVVVQPGLKWEALNEWLAEHGSNLYWPVDPGPGAAFGGMLSTGGSGTNAVRFGTMKGDYVLNLTVVLPSGEVITTRPRTRKFATSPDMTKLFLGAEGTLGLIVAATLRLAPRLPTTVGRATFATVEDACGAVREMLAQGVGVQSIELMDDVMVRCVNRAEAGAGGKAQSTSLLPEQPTLFIRFMGTPAHTTEDERLALSIVRRFGADTLTVAREPAECERLWHARKVALWSAMEYRESVSLRSDLTRDGDQEAAAREREELGPVKCWTTDCCVPLGKLPEMVKRVKADIKEAGLVGPLVGHAGDGNVHALLTFRANDKAEFERVRSVASRMVEHAQSLGGTASGEHGVGLGKRQYVERELGRGTVDLLRLLKRTLDPENIFNPGKLYPPETKAKAST
ncbi:D-lactate ferricytochrome c oxidoreductase [Tilletia horrida]|nr:D-lactate ferricytochrome c oxidoreductase [Tilletia horrida]